MVKKVTKIVLFMVIITAMLASCATQKQMPMFQAEDLNPILKSGDYMSKVDNFLILFDASGSMAGSHKGEVKLHLAKDIVRHMNQTIPDIKPSAGFRRFGIGSFSSGTPTKLLYGITAYTKAGLAGALSSIEYANGTSPLDLGIEETIVDLQPLPGTSAVIIISDGLEMDQNLVESAATKMKDQFGDRLCVYTVQIGNSPTGKALLERVAQLSACGFYVAGDDIMSAEGMADFVKKVFLMEAKDSDGDGVPDHLDKCPDTPRGAMVDANGCPLDSDGDGVYDGLDQCPDTPKGVAVDSKGCPLPAAPKDSDGDGITDDKDQCPNTPKGAYVNSNGCWVLPKVYFDTNKWNIKSVFHTVLNELVRILKNNPDVKLDVQGHADIRGAEKYNQRLSERRANSVKGYLEKMGIAGQRLNTLGFGFMRPAAPNDTADGMAKNRRVEFQHMSK